MSERINTLTDDERAYLEMYEPSTYGVNLPRCIATSLESKGFVEWLPPIGWSGRIWGITDAGRNAVAMLAERSIAVSGGHAL